MKKLLFLAIIVLFTNCTNELILEEKSQAQPQVVLCGDVYTVGTIYTPSNVFIGVRYEVVLDIPYFDGANTWTKASIILNNPQNTPSLNQYSTGDNICGTVNPIYFYN